MSTAPPTRIMLRPRPVANTPIVVGAAPVGLAAAPKLVTINSTAPQIAQAATPQTTQHDPVSKFIDLQVEARRCPDLDALRYAIVNSTRKLAHFDQAFLAEPTMNGTWAITRAASVTTVDRKSAQIRYVEAWIKQSQQKASSLNEPRLVNIESELPAKDVGLETLLPAHALWLPIKARDGKVRTALIALKHENWRPQHSALLMPLADAYGHAWAALEPHATAPAARFRSYVSKSRLAIGAAVVAMAAAFIPVPMSALAPAEVVAAKPMLVTAPIEGVIADVLIAPGTWVDTGTPIIRFVDIKLRNDAEIARRNKAVAEARHFKVVQSAVATQKDMQEIATVKAELDLAIAELRSAEDLLARSVVRAERPGLLIYAAKSDWIGKPVSLGERLMEIGNPANTELRIDLPVSDSIVLQRDGLVSLFLDGDPLRSVPGKLDRISYRPTLTTDQQLAFRIHAKFSDDQPHRIGQRGVARISGEQVSLWFYLFRRPISALRQRAGL
jgi:HlyD family secretion protein